MWIFIPVLLVLCFVMLRRQAWTEKPFLSCLNTSHGQQSMQFLAFYERLPGSRHRLQLLLTPQFIGVEVCPCCILSLPAGEYTEHRLGDDLILEQYAGVFFDRPFSIRHFRQLALSIRFKDGQAERPIITMPLYTPGTLSERQQYAKTLEQAYKRQYKKNVHILVL